MASHANPTAATLDRPARHDVSRADFDALRGGPVTARLVDHGVIEARGADAVAFLQGQLTNDVAALELDDMQFGGYCTAKGRLLALFTTWRDAEAVYLMLPRELLRGVLKRLSMFVLRAKVKLADASDQWQCDVVFGKDSVMALDAQVGPPPAEVWQTVVHGATRVLRLPDAPRAGARFLLVAPAQRAPGLSSIARVDVAAWGWTQIDAGVPEILSPTQEAFVPQMINAEVLGAVNFRKGCYPGQEIVARSQYLGKLRRRMSIAHCTSAPGAGDDVLDADGSPVGKVVLAATSPQAGSDLLFECPVDRLTAPLHLSRDAVPLRLLPLPYELHDVTA